MTYREAMAAAKRASHETNGQRIVCVALREADEHYDIFWDSDWQKWPEKNYPWRPIQRVWVLHEQTILLNVPENY